VADAGVKSQRPRSVIGCTIARRLLALSLAALALGGCGAPPVLRPGPAPATARTAPDAFEGGYANIEVLGENLVVVLPDAEGWRREPHTLRGWEATHTASGSRLVARTWRAEGRVDAGECERQMRLWRPDLPALTPELRFDERRGVIADYAVDLVASVDARPSAANGVLTAFGNQGRECLCLVFSTAARGQGASELVATRIGTMSRLFERARRVTVQARATRVEPQL
jgi:hypothetical protein